jgi:hypothetical protein
VFDSESSVRYAKSYLKRISRLREITGDENPGDRRQKTEYDRRIKMYEEKKTRG